MFKKFINSIKENVSNAWIFTKVLVFIILELGIIAGVILFDLPSAIGIVVSNILTFIIALAASKTFKTFSAKISKDEYELQRRERELKAENEQLKKSVRDLQNRVDTDAQTLAHFRSIDFKKQIVLCAPTDMGYVVKEETFGQIGLDTSLASLIPQDNLIEKGKNFFSKKFNIEQNVKSILCIDKVYHKNVIGIDLSKIKFSTNRQGEVLLSGVNVEVLYDASADMENQVLTTDIKHCFILSSTSDSSCEIKNDEKYRKLKDAYMCQQRRTTKESYIARNKTLCNQMTFGLQKSLMHRYQNLRFIEYSSNEYNSYTWRSLNDAYDNIQIMNILIDVYTGIDLLKNSNGSHPTLLNR